MLAGLEIENKVGDGVGDDTGAGDGVGLGIKAAVVTVKIFDRALVLPQLT